MCIKDHVTYGPFKGIVLAEEEGDQIAQTLGQKKAALLISHGLLTVGKNVEEAVWWFVALDKVCHAQLLADAAANGRGGETVKIGVEEAKATYANIGTPYFGWFSGRTLFDTIHKETGGEYLA